MKIYRICSRRGTDRVGRKEALPFMWSLSNRIQFERCISDLLATAGVSQLKDIGAHYLTNCYEHSLFVAYVSFLFCRYFNWDFVAAARGGLLHDLFLYDRKKDPYEGKHLLSHPRRALENAVKLAPLNDREKDIIVKHMWPLTWKLPKYRESFVVSTADKLCALTECLPLYKWMHVRKALNFRPHPETARISSGPENP